MPEVAFDRLMVDFIIRDGCLQFHIPVDQPQSPVNESVTEHSEEGVSHSPGTNRVKGKPEPIPVTRAAHGFELFENDMTILFPPFPDSLHQSFPANVMAGFTFDLKELSFHHTLGGDPGMIYARHPDNFIAFQSFLAAKDILKRVIQSMAHVKATGDIGGRNDYAIFGFVALSIAMKEIFLNPKLGEPAFASLGIIGFGDVLMAIGCH